MIGTVENIPSEKVTLTVKEDWTLVMGRKG
jgi:hypothetical protein